MSNLDLTPTDDETARPQRGGRAARRAARRDGAGKGETRAIWPGISGGSYLPLKPEEVEQVHETAIRVLDEVGLRGANERCIATVTAAGGRLTGDGRLLMPREVALEILSKAGRGFKLYARDPALDLDPSNKRIHLGTSGAAVHIIDSETREVRDSTSRDLYDFARLANALSNIHMFQRTVVARDLTDPFEMDLNTLYACLKGTAKPTGTSFTEASHMDAAIQILHMIAGGEDAFRARPFLCVSTCFIVPPLKFAEEALLVIERCADEGIPLKLVSAGQAGATSPAALAGCRRAADR